MIRIALVVMALVRVAAADTVADKSDARSLMQSGVKLFAAKDYRGALAVFEDAYERYQSAKLLLNIGTTLVQLDRKAEAANAYQRYLDASDADPAKRVAVTTTLAELDTQVATIVVDGAPRSAELQLDTAAWRPLAKLRVVAGDVTVRIRAPNFEDFTAVVHAAAGSTRRVTVVMLAVPVVATRVDVAAVRIEGPRADERPNDLDTTNGRARFGVVALAHVDVAHRGGAGLVGLTARVQRRVDVQALALLGANPGAYVGTSIALMFGRVRPVVAAGVPMFVASGLRVAVRAAVGVEVAVDRHFALTVELGVERVLDPEPNRVATLVVPAVGVIGRL